MKMRQNRRSRILAFLLSAMILVGMLPTAAWAQDGGVTCVTVDITAQRAGVFLMPPQFGVSVSSDLAESYGYTDQVTGGVSALDVAVKAHDILYGDRYTPDTKDAFLAVSSSGTVTRQFEEDTYNTGFYVNNMYPHDGTPAPYGGGYNGYMINQCPVADGDLVEIYTLASDYYADNYTWLLVDGEYTRDITMDVDAGLAVTVEGFYAFNAFICEDIDALIERGNPIEGIHLGVVDLSTGAITPIEGATTDEDGAATLRFSQAGEYIVVAYYTADEIDDMTAAVLTMTRVTVNGPAVQGPVMEITQADLEANGYETYYYCDDIIYTYQGEAVTFISESQIVAGGQTYALKNKKTDITIEEGADGSLTISLSNLSVPVGSIPSAWNSSYGGVVQMVYQTDIPSMAEVRSAASTGAPSSITLTGIPEGTYHLTGGTIYEQANEWSPGYDFGDGMVTAGCFGTLPDITLTVGGEAQQGGYLGVKTQAKVYDDFENDLWLQYQHREMQVGDTASMYPWRVAQIVSNSIANDVYRPNFHFEIISGDSVTLSGETTTDSVTVTAVKPGTSVVKVTYDEVDYNGQHWGAISDVNTGYVVYTVGETGTAVISANEELENWRHYDTIYYNEGETVPYTFTVEAQGAQTVAVTVNGIEIAGDGNRYTADLENRSNIIGIVATDAQGNTKSMYRIIDARFIEVDVENKTRPQQPLAAGDRANIRFRGITMPVYKLATIYNPQMGSNATKVTYENDKLGSFEGKCSQWYLATNNDFDVTFLEAGTYTFQSANGIFCAWWGSPLGTDATMHGSGEPNLGASTLQGYFSVLPDFTVSVADSIAVTSVALNKDKLDMRVGDTEQLSAQVLPTDATHPAVTWSSSDTSVATVADGLVTAVGNGQVQITATADGVQAVCSITVRGVDIQEVNQAIAQLPDADSLTLRDKAAVEAARQLYDDLSQDDQSRVTGYDRLTAAEARLSELMETPFLLSVGGQILPMEKTGEAAGYDGTYYKVTIPENTATVQLERYAQVEVQDGDFNTLVEAGATTVDIDTADYMGEDHYFTLHHDTFVYHHIYFEIAQEQPPQEDSITVSFTLLGDTAHGEPADEAGTHTLVGNNLETWIPAHHLYGWQGRHRTRCF